MKVIKKLIFEEPPFSIFSQRGIPQTAIDFLNSIKWGSEGAVYEHKNTEQIIKEIQNPTLLSIEENGVIVGIAVFCNNNVNVGDKTFNCNYIRYFSSSPLIRGRGLMKYFGKKVMELIQNDELKKTVFLGFVESGNISSYKVVKNAGYRKIGTVKTIGFSRFFPKKNKEIIQINTKKGRQEVLSLLKVHYFTHALVQFNSLFINDDYYVIRKNGEIVVGCQLHKAHWTVKNMGGITGKIIMNVVPYLPLVNQLFNPKKFKFLAFEGVYCKEGYERTLHTLFSGLLASHKLKSSLIWMGETSEHYISLVTYGKLGFLNNFVNNSDVYTLAAFKEMNSTEEKSFEENPIYASAFDYI
ncbi:MAG: GNAT family N-acetyltransferase [Flavobacteriaceae bacterium]|nr:GNAT family N-acetyltransferase [Flavobacteriaceae bacterium]